MTTSHNLAGNLSEHASCCGHQHWWRHQGNAGSGRKPFALPGTKKRYAPDMTVNVQHLKLVVAVDPVKKTLAGHCYTTVSPIAKPVSSVYFQAEDLKVESVKLVGTDGELSFEEVDKGILVQLGKTVKAGEAVTVDIQYHILSPKLGIYFVQPTAFYPNKPYQVWTQCQDDDAHHWLPIAEADHPNHKMTSEMVITVPKEFTALSNGALLSDQEAGDSRTYHWSLDKPHSCYLLALVVGEFARLEESYGDLKVEAYVHPSLLERAREYFKGTADLVKLFSKLYGVEYPWPYKYAQVFVEDFIFGGMENTTMTVMTSRILTDPATRAEGRLAEVRLNAHELNHHHNGDYTTCREWAHGWLNEGGATYGEVEAVEHIWGEKARDHYVYGLAKTYFAEDRRYRRPIVCKTYREPIDLFDRHLYQKGGLVRHMIRYLLGTEGYYAGIKTYYQDNKYQLVETDDFIKAFEKATGRNLRQFFDQWVYGSGFPEYKVSYRYDDRQKSATVKVEQTQKLEEDTGLFTMPIELSFDFADGSRKDVTVVVEDKEHSFTFNFDKKPTMFRFDPTNWVLKKLDLNVPKGMLLTQVKSDPSVMGRIYAAQALAKLGGDDIVSALEASAKQDFFWGVGAEIASSLGGMNTASAREALKRLAAVKEPRVRRAVVTALGNFKDESVAKLLADIISGGNEESQFVIADAAASLGKTKWKEAFPVLKQASTMPSWNEIIAVGALNGLAELQDERGIEVATDLASSGKPWLSRPAAIAALGKLTAKGEAALTALHDLADSEEGAEFTLRMSLVNALGEAKKADSLPVLNRMAGSSYDGRVKRLIAETVDSIKDSAKKEKEAAKKAVEDEAAKQTRDLTDKVEGLSSKLAVVEDELARLRSAKKGGKKGKKQSEKSGGKKQDGKRKPSKRKAS